MARKRLTPPFASLAALDPAVQEALSPGSEPAPEVKAMPFGPAARAVSGRPRASAPISHVMGETAATAALETLADVVARARSEGRMVEALALSAVDEAHLVRDRVGFDEEDFRALVESLRLHGQRTPVEVADLGQGRYGLISGWRRLSALRRLAEETGEARFGRVLALIRTPQAAGDAYVAMVEENEIRAGLSYYERARIAARSAAAGAFVDRQEALRALYAAASRAKRSKIGSFLIIHDALDGVLRFPAAIPERLGLALAARLAEEGFAERLAAGLRSAPSGSAEEELAALSRAVEEAAPARKEGGTEGTPRKAARGGEGHPETPEDPAIRLERRGGRVILSGSGVDAAFVARLEGWLKAQPGEG